MTNSLNPGREAPAEGPRDSAYTGPSGAETNQGRRQ